MLDEPIRDPRLLQAMEACRPDSEDLADPELAFLADQLAADPGLRAQFDRLKAFDRAVAEAFADVPVPESLEQRILTRIQPQTQRSANQPAENIAPETAPTPTADSAENGLVQLASSPPGESTASPTASMVPSLAASGSPDVSLPGEVSRGCAGSSVRQTRRWWLAVAAGGALAAVAAGVVVVVTGALSRPPTFKQLLDEVVADAAQNLHSQTPVGAAPDQVAPPANFPLSRQVAALRPTRWRMVELAGQRGVAYDLPRCGRARATLYVLESGVSGLPAVPPRKKGWFTFWWLPAMRLPTGALIWT